MAQELTGLEPMELEQTEQAQMELVLMAPTQTPMTMMMIPSQPDLKNCCLRGKSSTKCSRLKRKENDQGSSSLASLTPVEKVRSHTGHGRNK